MSRDHLEGVALAYARGGDAIVETADGNVFVAHAVPGDHVRITRPKRARGALHASLLAVTRPSLDRVDAPCPYVRTCGGCPLMEGTIALQRATKREVVSKALGHDAPIEHAGDDLGYRVRARLGFDARGRLGYRRAGSSAVVDVARCVVLAPPLAGALETSREALRPVLAGEGELRLAMGEGERPVMRVVSDVAQPPAVYAALEALVRDGVIAGASVLAGGATKPAVIGDPRERTRAFDGGVLVGTDGGFSQANRAVNARLVELARGFARTQGASVLELYAGHGNLTVALAPGARAYTAVERDPEAAAALGENVAARGLDVRVRAVDAARAPSGAVDVVVLDPPRAGAADAIAGILRAAPSRVVYVSCDPGTLARDVRALVAQGYALREAVALDMFPHTPHVETVAWLERVPAS